MSYAFYKIIHVVSIVLFFALYMSAVRKDRDIKKEVIFSGVALILILVSGMGLIAKIGIPHGTGWPLWLQLKLGIWVFIAIAGHTIMKRFAKHKLKFFWLAFLLLTCASYLANYKIG